MNSRKILVISLVGLLVLAGLLAAVTFAPVANDSHTNKTSAVAVASGVVYNGPNGNNEYAVLYSKTNTTHPYANVTIPLFIANDTNDTITGYLYNPLSVTYYYDVVVYLNDAMGQNVSRSTGNVTVKPAGTGHNVTSFSLYYNFTTTPLFQANNNNNGTAYVVLYNTTLHTTLSSTNLLDSVLVTGLTFEGQFAVQVAGITNLIISLVGVVIVLMVIVWVVKIFDTSFGKGSKKKHK